MKSEKISQIRKTEKNYSGKVLKRAALWNMAASILNALMSAVLLFFIMRLNGVKDAGIFSIASALAYQTLTAGLFGVRNFQAADIHKEYTFWDYFYLRLLSSLLMYIMIVYYSFFQGYSTEKAWVIFSFSLFKSLDALEDVFHGELQRKGRLDTAAFYQTVRYSLSLILLAVLLFTTHSLSVTFLWSTLASLLIFTVQNISGVKQLYKEKRKLEFRAFKNLLVVTIPLAISSWLNIYILNASKYSIDRIMASQFQAYFSTLVMPVFTINLLAVIAYRPFITILSKYWKERNYQAFYRGMLQQVGVILLLSIFISIFGYIIGLRLLEIIYNMELQPFMLCFMLLLGGGGMNTLAVFFSVILTIQKKQNWILAGYGLAFTFCLIYSDTIVKRWTMTGAGVVYFTASFILAQFYLLCIILTWIRERKIHVSSRRSNVCNLCL